MMDLVIIKKSLRMSVIVVILVSANLIRITEHSTIRAVEAVSFLALGTAIGVLLVNFFLYLKFKKSASENNN